MINKNYYVYINTNQRHTVLYIGITNNILDRNNQHKKKINKRSFTYRYNVDKLVYYETFDNVAEAIAREKQIKNYSRKKKEILINSINPEWRDLSKDF